MKGSDNLIVLPWRSGDCKAGAEIAGIEETSLRLRWRVEREVRVRRRRKEDIAMAAGVGGT